VGCVHNINIRTHPLFRDFIIKGEDGKILDFEGCIFHLQTLFLRQSWVRQIGIQAAVESRGDATKYAVHKLVQLAIGNIDGSDTKAPPSLPSPV
jgi:hypothetical protein